jgi:hypothetical protein
MEGIARVHGSSPNKKTALLRDPLLELVDRIDPTTTVGLRDRALLGRVGGRPPATRARRPGGRGPLPFPQAARDGHHPTQIAATTRHQDQRVLAGYIRAGLAAPLAC